MRTRRRRARSDGRCGRRGFCCGRRESRGLRGRLRVTGAGTLSGCAQASGFVFDRDRGSTRGRRGLFRFSRRCHVGSRPWVGNPVCGSGHPQQRDTVSFGGPRDPCPPVECWVRGRGPVEGRSSVAAAGGRPRCRPWASVAGAPGWPPTLPGTEGGWRQWPRCCHCADQMPLGAPGSQGRGSVLARAAGPHADGQRLHPPPASPVLPGLMLPRPRAARPAPPWPRALL